MRVDFDALHARARRASSSAGARGRPREPARARDRRQRRVRQRAARRAARARLDGRRASTSSPTGDDVLACDVTDDDGGPGAVRDGDRSGSAALDALVNNAGIGGPASAGAPPERPRPADARRQPARRLARDRGGDRRTSSRAAAGWCSSARGWPSSACRSAPPTASPSGRSPPTPTRCAPSTARTWRSPACTRPSCARRSTTRTRAAGLQLEGFSREEPLERVVATIVARLRGGPAAARRRRHPRRRAPARRRPPPAAAWSTASWRARSRKRIAAGELDEAEIARGPPRAPRAPLATVRRVIRALPLVLALGMLLALPAAAGTGNPWLDQRVIELAHQGGEGEAPSNTMYAFKRAIAWAPTCWNSTSTRPPTESSRSSTTRRSTGRPTAPASSAKRLGATRPLDAAHNFVPGENAVSDRPASEYPLRGVRTGERTVPASAALQRRDFRDPQPRRGLQRFRISRSTSRSRAAPTTMSILPA